MTDFRSSRLDQDLAGTTHRTAPANTGWAGWVRFAAFLMILNGALQALQGFAALVNPDYYRVTSSGLAVSIDYSAWGWIHLTIGVALFVSGMGVLSGNLLARIVGV